MTNTAGPHFAPGMHTEEQLDQQATKEELKEGEYTEVTQIIVDHTPED